jgi:hypothetical protein
MFCSWARMAGLSQSSRVLRSDGDHGRVFCFTCSRCPRSAGSPRAASCSLCWLSERRLRNTFVVAASVAALIEAGRRCLPMLHDRLTRLGLFVGTPYESWALRQAYQFAPTADFCRARPGIVARITGRHAGAAADVVRSRNTGPCREDRGHGHGASLARRRSGRQPVMARRPVHDVRGRLRHRTWSSAVPAATS